MLVYSDSSNRGEQRKAPPLPSDDGPWVGFPANSDIGGLLRTLATSMTILATQQLTSDSI